MLLVVSACAGDAGDDGAASSTTTITSSSTTTTAPAPATITPSRDGVEIGACEGLDPIETGTFNLAGREGAIVHVPESYDPDDGTPVVLVLHGTNDDPKGTQAQTGLSDLADEQGFLAVYPVGRELSLSVGTGWSLTTAREPTQKDELQRNMAAWLTEGLADGNADIAYVEDLLDELQTIFCINENRIYVTGHSMGGGFAFILGCTLSDRIAAIGPVSVWAVKGLGECAPTRPVPVMGIFSIDDSGYDGGEWAPYVEAWSFPEFGELWAALNDCTPGSEAVDQSGGATLDAWSGCSQPVAMWTLSDGGHTWPGSGELFASADLDASRVLWAFFKQNSLSP
jgi:polyhydroxybutyrate depolymerase